MDEMRFKRIEAMIKELQQARDADLLANSTLFVRVHNLEQRLAPAELPLNEVNLTRSYALGYKDGQQSQLSEVVGMHAKLVVCEEKWESIPWSAIQWALLMLHNSHSTSENYLKLREWYLNNLPAVQ